MYSITYLWIYLSNSELNTEKALRIKQDYVMFAFEVFFLIWVFRLQPFLFFLADSCFLL